MTTPGLSSLTDRPFVVGLLCAVIAVPIAYVALTGYVALTVSVADTRLIAHLIEGSLFAVGTTTFCSGLVSSYLSSDPADEG